jgi:hypothetical protein
MMVSLPKRCFVFYGPKHKMPPGCHYVAEGPCPLGSGKHVIYIRRGGWDKFDEHYAMLAVDFWFTRMEDRLKRLKAKT